jgi:hypothetical protein
VWANIKLRERERWLGGYRELDRGKERELKREGAKKGEWREMEGEGEGECVWETKTYGMKEKGTERECGIGGWGREGEREKKRKGERERGKERYGGIGGERQMERRREETRSRGERERGRGRDIKWVRKWASARQREVRERGEDIRRGREREGGE